MRHDPSNHSKTAEAMGAKMNIKGPPQALYLVIGNGVVDPLITQAGGQITMRFSGDKLLAVLSYEGFIRLKSDFNILRIGPVNLDMERLKRLSESLSKATVSQPGSAG